MYAQRIYKIRYTAPGESTLREQARAWFDPKAYRDRFQKANPTAVIEGVYDQATDTKIL